MVMLEGVEAIIGGGVESITMMERDTSPNPWVVEHHPAVYMAMGDTAEVVAKRYGVTRQAQDELSLASQQRIARAQREGWLKDELAPIQVRRNLLDKKTGAVVGQEDALVEADECNRARHHAGGPAQAAAGVRHQERPGQRHRRQLVAAVRRRVGHARDVARAGRGDRRQAAARVPRLRGRRAASPTRWASARCSPIPKLLKKHGLQVDDIDVWELNEAFASQVVYCRDKLGIPRTGSTPTAARSRSATRSG